MEDNAGIHAATGGSASGLTGSESFYSIIKDSHKYIRSFSEIKENAVLTIDNR